MATQLQLQAEGLNPQDIISVSNGQLRTTSLKVAESFGKLHKNVIQKIEALEASGCPAEWTSANFSAHVQSVEIGNGAKRDSKVYEMTKDGFALLVMGFTGKKAMAVKIAYINAFNWMVEQLQDKSSRLESIPHVEYKGRPVIAFDTVDYVHQSAKRHASKRFYEKHLKTTFIDGLDYFVVPYSEREQMAKQGVGVHVRGAVVLTQTGYDKLTEGYTAPGAPFVRKWLMDHYFSHPQGTVGAEEAKVLRDAFGLVGRWLQIQGFSSSEEHKAAQLFDWRQDMHDYGRAVQSGGVLDMSNHQLMGPEVERYKEAHDLLIKRAHMLRDRTADDEAYAVQAMHQRLDEINWAKRWSV